MEVKMLNLGYGNVLLANRIKHVSEPDNSPIKRTITEARKHGRIVDATYGRRTRSVIITDSDHVVLSSMEPELIRRRLKGDT